jgi:hypothetical protein
MALQEWFTTSGGFRYSTAVADADADMASFLGRRVGYCEQFAAAMAVMARTLGIPARVMVGFTSGRVHDGVWSITDSDAHAWPELLMGSAGWVRFEPTPRADSISLPSYASAEVAVGQPSQGPQPAPSASDRRGGVPAGSADRGGTARGGTAAGHWPGIAVVLLLLALGATPAVMRWSRRRRRDYDGPDGPSAAYREVVDTMIDLGRGRPGGSERATLLMLAEGLTPQALGAAGRIATAVERARYGPPVAVSLAGPGGTGLAPAGPVPVPGGPACAPGLRGDVTLLCEAMGRAAGGWMRVRALVLPVSLWR